MIEPKTASFKIANLKNVQFFHLKKILATVETQVNIQCGFLNSTKAESRRLFTSAQSNLN
jgi:hypothetical protein